MKKYIIREVEPEACDFSYYFDDDGLSERSGDYCNTLFIVPTRDSRGFNGEEWESLCKLAENVQDGFSDIGSNSWQYSSYKECMRDNCIPYNSRKCHALKEWAPSADVGEPEDMAAFLSILTGKKWAASSAYGYCQGDFCELVFCEERYKNGVQNYGEVWLGAAKEFCVIELDENGEECDSCYSFIVADCEAHRDEDYKKLVSEWYGIDEEETQLEMIDYCTTRRCYSYRVA